MNRAASGSSFLSVMTAASKWSVLFVALVLVALIGWFDYATGWESDASTLYASPSP